MRQILIVDDDVRMARIIDTYLRSRGYQVTICAEGTKALDLIAKNPPNLIILDVAMPGMDGLEVCRCIRERYHQSPIPVLFLSGHDSTGDRIAGLEAGADDYLVKPFELRELELRVEALLRRFGGLKGGQEPLELSVGGLRLDTRQYKAYVKEREVQLTPVEYELLRYLMLRAGVVISAEQLLQEVWRYYPGTGDTAVVRVQIMNLRDKIENDRHHPVYIQTIYRHGYMVSNSAA